MGSVQLTLLGHEEPAIVDGFARLRRTDLDAESWLEHVPGFISGHEALFDTLSREMRWHSQERVMYERTVAVPRLLASVPQDGHGHPVLALIDGALSERYQASFERVGLALYRDGQDSVAWHRDKMPRDRPTLVAVVSLGTPRRFLVRPFGGGRSLSFNLGWGDLMVMGGACQQRWEHCVPKVSHAHPRLSLVFRHVYD